MATLTHSPAPALSPIAPASPVAHGLTEDQKNWYACLYFLGSVGLSFLAGIVGLILV